MSHDKQQSLGQRVQAFNMLELPGQPRAMHMGTNYLVQDLWARVQMLEKALMPFADYADSRRVVNEKFIITAGSSLAKTQLTMGDCYRAWEAINGPTR